MDWWGRHLPYAYGGLAVGVLVLVVAWILGGNRGLGWAGLVLGAGIILAGVRLLLRNRRQHQPPLWSPVFFGGFLASYSLRRVAPANWEVPLLSVALVLIIAAGIALWREDRRADAFLKSGRTERSS